jgi:hypothetical protein
VEVIDDEMGIEGVMYIESVTFSQSPMVTELHLMRIDDLVFAEEATEVVDKRPGLVDKPGVAATPKDEASRIKVAFSIPWTTSPNEGERVRSIAQSQRFSSQAITFDTPGIVPLKPLSR